LAGEPEASFKISLPVACEIGKSCFVQNYVDDDPGPGVRDWACGAATYNGHDGIDIRVLSAADTGAGTAVVAVAGGTVKGVRDGMTDVFAVGSVRDAIKGRECGNGLVIDHGGGWETQYCHMRRGSLAVAPGSKVARGQRLGDIGYSGLVEFAHLHLTVRNNGKAVDPFIPEGQPGACSDHPETVSGLWTPEAAKALGYSSGQLIGLGFSGVAPDTKVLENDHTAAPLTRMSDNLILYARLINARGGDRVRLTIKGPSGLNATSVSEPFDRPKAVSLVLAGGKRTVPAWPSGVYEGTAQVLRGDTIVSGRETRFDLRD
jgi:murein DD-endopeptidase MepM/ murein hydrolase activator NlpD